MTIDTADRGLNYIRYNMNQVKINFGEDNPECDLNMGDTTLRYSYRKHHKASEWTLFPKGMKPYGIDEKRAQIATHPHLEGTRGGGKNYGNSQTDNAVQASLRGMGGPSQFGEGLTMRNGKTVSALELKSLNISNDTDRQFITLEQHVPTGGVFRQVVEHQTSSPCLLVSSEFENTGKTAQTLDMLSSVSINHLSPFALDDAPGRLKLHRFRSFWSLEGRHEAQFLEDLHLERSFGSFPICEHFGQVGSSPVRQFFPFVAIEDVAVGVFWGIQLIWHGSWQMECYRRDDTLSLSAGLADRLHGHWWKTIQPGETFKTPKAIVATVQGDIDDLCHAMIQQQEMLAFDEPEKEKALPIIFNEWCSSWGKPTQESMASLNAVTPDLGVDYLVMDAGWSVRHTWDPQCIGDWKVDRDSFPEGLSPVTEAIRKSGMTPGIWFEYEYVSPEMDSFDLTDGQLHRDGVPLEIRERRAWDFRTKTAKDYLDQKLIGRLREDNFGYLKIDYNESLGIGCDGAESLGEALRQHLVAQFEYLKKIRENLPDLIVENCSSGGHRLEPGMVGLTSMSSFSDAHETIEIPIIAANVQRLIPARKNQIWMVCRSDDTIQRLNYSLAATFLGRMCISGDVYDLTEEQYETIKRACHFYKKVSHIIRDGKSKVVRKMGRSWRYPEGWQAVLRTTENEVLIVLHNFEEKQGTQNVIEFPLPAGNWQVENCLNPNQLTPELVSNQIRFSQIQPFSGTIIQLKNKAIS